MNVSEDQSITAKLQKSSAIFSSIYLKLQFRQSENTWFPYIVRVLMR